MLAKPRRATQGRLDSNLSFAGMETLEHRLLMSADPGLLGEYFNSINLTDSAGTRVDAVIDFPTDWGDKPAGTNVVNDDTYSVRWTGAVNAETGGDYTFYSTSNDGVRLWINDQLIIDHWENHPVTEDIGQIALQSGWHDLRMEYYQSNGTAEVTLSMAGPGLSKQIIPQHLLLTEAPADGLPTADAGEDQVLLLPQNSITLTGSGADADGTIDGYQWTQLDGPDAQMLDAQTSKLTLTDLAAGAYTFELTVTDNEGNAATDVVAVTVTDGDGVVSGELKMWHAVTVSFEGPQVGENSSINPFLDYRLNVTFTGPSGQTYVTPGYFAADGDAGHTGARSGNIWQARFNPDEAGEWTYTASFRTGDRVAVSLDPAAGSAAGFDGASGRFTVADSDKTGQDLRGKGQLRYVGGHYLQFAGNGEYFIKNGADSPENLLGYTGFDNTPQATMQYAAHLSDWSAGDPDWDSPDAAGTTDGRAIIGAINYLASQGVNSIYFLPMNIGGDGQDTSPFASTSLNWAGSTSNDNTRYDVSKLEQWEMVFAHAQSKGIALHFVLTEAEEANKRELSDGNLGYERKLFYREMIARFGHHNAVQWNISEEYNYKWDLGEDRIRAFADYINEVDPYGHQVTVHNQLPDLQYTWYKLLGEDRWSSTSIQQGRKVDDLGDVIEDMRERSAAAGRPLAVMMDEAGSLTRDVTNFNQVRKRMTWEIYLSGGGTEWFSSSDDISLQDFSKFEQVYHEANIAVEFMQQNLPFWEMTPSDHLVQNESDLWGGAEVLAKEGEVYAIHYTKSDNTGQLDLRPFEGAFELTWFDPRTGGFVGQMRTLTGGSWVDVGSVPDGENPNTDYVALIRKAVDAPLEIVDSYRNDGAFRPDQLASLSLVFNRDPGDALSTANLTIRNIHTDALVDLGSLGEGDLTWNADTLTARWDLTSVPLAPGEYAINYALSAAADASAPAHVITELVALTGDVNLDGQIDSDDVSTILAAGFFNQPGGGANWSHGDFDHDGDVDNDDIMGLLSTAMYNAGPYVMPDANAPAGSMTLSYAAKSTLTSTQPTNTVTHLNLAA